MNKTASIPTLCDRCPNLARCGELFCDECHLELLAVPPALHPATAHRLARPWAVTLLRRAAAHRSAFTVARAA